MVFQLAGVGGSRRHGADRARQVARLTRFEMNSAALNVCGGNLVAEEDSSWRGGTLSCRVRMVRDKPNSHCFEKLRLEPSLNSLARRPLLVAAFHRQVIYLCTDPF